MRPIDKLLIILSVSVLALVLLLVITFFPSGTKIRASDEGNKVEFSKCSRCHGIDLDNFKTPGLIFNHGVHFENGIRCANCHRESPHVQDKIVRVNMDTCYGCHGLRHSKRGLVAGENCELCHTPGFNLVPTTHNSQFKTTLHKEDALRDPLYCRMCHTEEWCSACHNTRKVTPRDHRAKEVWRERHGRGKKELNNCRVCHNNALFCDECHQTPVPHLITWLGKHAKRAKVESLSCKVCHQERQYCQECHHGQLGSNTLVQKNCEKCHTDYRLPLLLVRGRTHMVHKAHFELTNREPFKCEDCHELRVARATGLQYYAVCYYCHGKYRLGKLIAKWGGYELCYRCHQGAPGAAPMGQQLPGIPVPGPSTPGPGIEQQLSPRR